MKIIIIFTFLIGKYAFAMGDPHFIPGNPHSANELQHLNNIEETSSGINQFSDDRGYDDQQMMEDKEIKKKKVKDEDTKKEKQIPIEKMKTPYVRIDVASNK